MYLKKGQQQIMQVSIQEPALTWATSYIGDNPSSSSPQSVPPFCAAPNPPD